MPPEPAPADPVTVELVRGRLRSLMDELDFHFYRSGYSTIVRESRDFSCVILDAEGRLAVPPNMFFHGPVYTRLVRAALACYGADGLAPGDVIVCNHPYEAELPHVPDMAVLAPIFVDESLVGFAASIAHKADVGGAVPGSSWGQATELYQEGMLLPPVRLHAGGLEDGDLVRLIAANSRAPELVLGDLAGQIGAVRLGCRRIEAFCRRLGRTRYEAALAAILAGTAAALRAALATLPDGTHAAEGFLDSDGVERDRPVRLAVRVTVAAGTIRFDFGDSGPATKGPVNLRRALVEACCFQALIGFLDPGLAYSDTFREVVRIDTRPGSVLDAAPPAPVSSYMMCCHKLVDVILDALGRFRPARAIAHSGGSGGAVTIAWGRPRRPGIGNQYEIFGSALGATGTRDGATGVTVHLANIHVTPIEIVESEFPCRVTAFEPIAGSGGKGRFRGGLAIRRSYALDAPATVVYRADRARVPAKGLAGGGDGAPSRLVLDPGGPEPQVMPSSCRLELDAGRSFTLETAAGGGYGDPAARDPAARAADAADGYIAG